MTADTFGEKLANLRRLSGASQVETARRLKLLFPDMRISQTSISALESRRKSPRGTVVENLVRYFGVDEDYFVGPHDTANERLEKWRAFKDFKADVLKRLDEFEQIILNDEDLERLA